MRAAHRDLADLADAGQAPGTAAGIEDQELDVRNAAAEREDLDAQRALAAAIARGDAAAARDLADRLLRRSVP